MMRRTTKILAVASSGLLLLGACGQGSDEPSKEGPSQPEKLVVWTYYTSQGQIEAMDAQNELWTAEHPDIPIEHVQIPFDQLPSKLLATATTEDGPDVVLDNVVVDFPTLAAAGVLTDLTEYWDGYADKEMFPDSALWRKDEAIYNVMSYTNLLGLYYNADALKKLNLEPPTTVDEFQAALEAVKADGEYKGLAESGAPTVEGAWMLMPLMTGEGVDYCNIDVDSAKKAFERVEGWAKNDIIPRETATWNQADAWQAFMSGEYAFGINGNWNLADVPTAAFEIGTARFPAGSEGSHVFPGGEAIGIGAFSDNKDLAWEYIETAWMSGDAGLINFEGSGQIPTRSDLADDPKISGEVLVAPFIAAASETNPWPNNEQTATMQTAVGENGSAVMSGATTAQAAAEDAVKRVEEAKEAGGGGC